MTQVRRKRGEKVLATATPDLHRVHCRGCGRTTAWATDKYHKVFCRPWCEKEAPVFSNEERDDTVAYLYRRGWSAEHLADKFGITRQRTHQIIRERMPA